MTKVALTVAGSDSGGGAGIQADLKTFAFHCVHGASAITCVTSQNTLGVTDVLAVQPSMVKSQLAAVTNDLTVSAVKTGMLLNQTIIESVATFLVENSFKNIVVDPVMVSRAGVQLIDDGAVISLCERLIPLAEIVTPNIYEAQILARKKITSVAEMKQSASIICDKLSAKVVLIKGGGLANSDRACDVFFDGKNYELFDSPRVNTRNTHGTGCTLSAAITANLALGKDLRTAVDLAKIYVTNALHHSLEIGSGNGPVGHFFPLLTF